MNDMKNSIDLYIRPKKKMWYMSRWHMRDPIGVHRYGYTFPPERRKSTTKHLSEAEENTIKLLEDFSEEKGIILSIHTIITRRDILGARLKGIRETPATVIGNQVIIGIPTIEEIEAAMAVLNGSICEE